MYSSESTDIGEKPKVGKVIGFKIALKMGVFIPGILVMVPVRTKKNQLTNIKNVGKYEIRLSVFGENLGKQNELSDTINIVDYSNSTILSFEFVTSNTKIPACTCLVLIFKIVFNK